MGQAVQGNMRIMRACEVGEGREEGRRERENSMGRERGKGEREGIFKLDEALNDCLCLGGTSDLGGRLMLVQAIYPGGPAHIACDLAREQHGEARAIQVGDVLFRIGDIEVLGRDPLQVRSLLRGPPDTKVVLQFLRKALEQTAGEMYGQTFTVGVLTRTRWTRIL
eukprot:763731-Hanusia_phi.AAC.1